MKPHIVFTLHPILPEGGEEMTTIIIVKALFAAEGAVLFTLILVLIIVF